MATPKKDDQDTPGSADGGVLSRYPAAVALTGGVAAAFGSSFIPMNAIEGFVTAYGIAELLPAAAPPLGDTARLALSAGIGTLTAGALLALLPRAESEDMGFETAIQKAEPHSRDQDQGIAPAPKSGKLAGWLRTLRFGKADAVPGTISDFGDLGPKRIRNGDHHPDAPVRAPIRASADLGAPLDAPEPAMPAASAPPITMSPPPLELGDELAYLPPAAPEPEVAPEPVPAPSLRFAPPPFAPPPMAIPVEAEPEHEPKADHAAEPEMPALPAAARAASLAPSMAPETQSQPADSLTHATPAEMATEQPQASDLDAMVATSGKLAVHSHDDDLDALSIGDLLTRLEDGLARRRQQAAQLGQDLSSARIIPIVKAPAERDVPASEPAPFKLRLGDAPAEDETSAPLGRNDESAGDAFRAQPIWGDEIEYLPPSIGGAEDQPEPDTTAAEIAAPTMAEAAQDDDMDAALRDALATLRQLSDRQRTS